MSKFEVGDIVRLRDEIKRGKPSYSTFMQNTAFKILTVVGSGYRGTAVTPDTHPNYPSGYRFWLLEDDIELDRTYRGSVMKALRDEV